MMESEPLAGDRAKNVALAINEGLAGTGLYKDPKGDLAEGQHTTWRVSPEPFWIDRRTYDFFESLGPHLLRFYEAANRLYLHALRGSQPDWVRHWLETGKSETALDYARMRRFRSDLPLVIRPDVLPTDDGFAISELDSVPGGMGLLAAVTKQYALHGVRDIVGDADGMVEGFAAALRSLRPDLPAPVVAIVVSDESDSYRNEMEWLAGAATGRGLDAFTVHPRDLMFQEDGLFLPQEVTGSPAPIRIDIVYRFFELFDLKNIPKIDLLLYAVRKELVTMTPPLKFHLEEKSLFALFHHPVLAPFWQNHLGSESVALLKQFIPPTWVMDPTPMPPHGVIPGLQLEGRAVTDWNELKGASQKARELVIKPSGYSAQAWGSRGVSIGHDMSQDDWAATVDQALAAFENTPHVLQSFRKGAQFRLSYYDFEQQSLRGMRGRARLCPYYFVSNGKTHLAGILATVSPLNKKLIHGMVDAIMVPCAVR